MSKRMTHEVDKAKLREKIAEKGLSLSDASRMIGRSESYLSVVVGKNSVITEASIKLLESVLGIKPEEYVKKDKEEPKRDVFDEMTPDWDEFVVPMKVVVCSETDPKKKFISDVYDVKYYNSVNAIEMLVYQRDRGFYYQCTEDPKGGGKLIKRATYADMTAFLGVPEGTWQKLG